MTRRQLMAGVAFAAAGTGGSAAAQGSGPSESFKAVTLVKRRGDLTYEQFRVHQFETHVPLAHRLPGLMSYEFFLFAPGADGSEQPYDGMAVLEWENLEAFQSALASEQGAAALADLPLYLDKNAAITLTGPTTFWLDGFGT